MRRPKVQRLCLSLVLASLFFGSVCCAQVADIRERFLHSDELMIAAHRAAHEDFPENSIEAIHQAIEIGVDIIELDIRVTKDGVPVIMHDQTIDRTTTGSGNIELLDFEAIHSLKLLHNGKATDQTIPTLKAALFACKDKVMVDMDMKTDQIDAVLQVVAESGTADQLIFFDADWGVLGEIRKKLSGAYLMPRTYKRGEIKKAVKKLDPVAIHIDPSFYDRRTVKLAKKHGVRIWINSLGDRDHALRGHQDVKGSIEWVERGANMVQTDLPEFWVSVRDGM
ncbi:glycerophosphodiester phosphodiesterase family protein [Echinicola rosea]|uniref:Glycerophosphoryl diester phosphodiesterase n=1 Tax=Echinicola rosea TaxID=1807691 RepID=A0ABQ1UYZ0_9BACT|nr:glycerophosphodiester phosphodiesterase family protein [Echinicola rosea]GGF31037.1 glycerophosphoryl diester phosphodiesterase [Echinicola rosea]